MGKNVLPPLACHAACFYCGNCNRIADMRHQRTNGAGVHFFPNWRNAFCTFSTPGVALLKCVGRWEWQTSGIHSSCSKMVKDQGQGSSPPLLLQTNQSTPHAPNDIGSNQWNPNGAKVQSLGDAGCNKPLLASNWFHQDGQDGPLSTYWAYLAYGVWLSATRTPHFLGLYKRWISWKTNHFKSCNIHVSIVRYQGPGHQPLQGLRVDSLSERTISLYLIIHYQPASQTLPVEVEGTCQLCSQLESHCLLYWWGDMSEKHCGQLRSAR